MIVISPPPLSILCHQLRPQTSPPRTPLSAPVLRPKFSPIPPRSRLSRNRTAIHGSNLNDPKESAFMDENGVVTDMDGYLNYLSLEYDSVWDTKPSWCQPWTITLTGIGAITCSWLILHSVIVTTVVLCIISAWCYIFLYSYPKAYSDMIAERRKKVTDGVEDTFGLENGQ